MATITIQWEDGVSMSTPMSCTSKSEAFALLDAWMKGVETEHRTSLRVVIMEDGVIVWSQLGSHVEVNT